MAENDVSWLLGGCNPGHLRVCQRRRKRSACSASLSIVVLWAFEAFRRPSDKETSFSAILQGSRCRTAIDMRLRQLPIGREQGNPSLAACQPLRAHPKRRGSLPIVA